MNKKFLSAILFGALMVSSTGTFVSCKDYDDDIDNLQEQINKLATKEDMTSQIATLQAALDAAKTEAAAAKASAEQAVAKANSAESTATEAEKAAAQAALDAANAKAEAIKAAQDEVAKVKAELEAAIDSKFEAEKEALAKTISELTETVTKLTGLTTDMITSIDLQAAEGFTTKLYLNYYQIADNKTWGGKTSYTFGKDMEGSFTVSAGEIFANPASLLVSVAPANAALPAEILSIVDSEGTSINDYINLTSSSYTDKLYKDARAASNGLYTVTAELKKDADKKAFAKLLDDGKTTSDKKYVAFAVAATKENRTVTSTYDVTIQSTTNSITEAIEIDTRSTIKSSIEEEGTLKDWNGYKGQTPSITATPNNEDCYPVVDGEAFTIKVASKADAVATETGTSKVLASYVVVDIENKALSTTDKAAIKSLTITGDVNKVSKENVFNIAIGGTYSKGVVVPLKVVTIDYTGEETTNVVWVKAGGSSEVTQIVTYVVTPDSYVADGKQYPYEGINAFVVPAGATSYKLAITDEEDNFSITEDKTLLDGTILTFFKDAKGKEAATEASEVAYAKLAATLNLQAMKDSKVYEGTVKFYNNEGTFLSQSTVKIQKVLPTAFPSAFSAKTNAINNGVLTVYPEPTSATDKNGVFAFSKAFNGLDGANALEHIVFSSNDVNLVGDGKEKPVNAKFTNSTAYTINTINPNLINDGKTYGAKVAYDYGDIAYTYKKADNSESNNWSVDWATSFSIKFGCMIVDSKYSWVSEPVVYYNEDTVIGAISNKKAVDVISVKDAYNAVMDPFTDAANWNKWAAPIDGTTKVTLQTTNEAGKVIDNEFYTAKFEKATVGDYSGKWTLKLTKKSTEVVLKDDVKTSVIITITDKFGHEHNVPALTFTMKKSH